MSAEAASLPTAALRTCVEVLVKYQTGAYCTQTVKGKRATSTMSPGQAVSRLGKKLFGTEGLGIQVRTVGTSIELWRIEKPATAAELTNPRKGH